MIIEKKGVRKAAHQFGLLLLLDDQRKLALTEMAGHRSEQCVFYVLWYFDTMIILFMFLGVYIQRITLL